MNFVRIIKQALDGIRFRKGEGYDAEKLWESRHRKYDSDFRAVANEKSDSEARYRDQERLFRDFLRECGIDPAGARCLEFGCGNGFWANVLLGMGAAAYVGVDISETAVANCARAVPAGRFERADVSDAAYRAVEPFDLACSIDVTQHVVERAKLERFLLNMRDAVRPGGWIVLTSYAGYGDDFNDPEKERVIAGVLRVPKLRWVHTWETSTISGILADCELHASAPFWDKTILAYRRGGTGKRASTNTTDVAE